MLECLSKIIFSIINYVTQGKFMTVGRSKVMEIFWAIHINYVTFFVRNTAYIEQITLFEM